MENIFLTTDNQLKEVKDKATIFSLLSGAKENDSDVFVWRLIGGQKHLGRMKVESFRKSDSVLCLVLVDENLGLVKEIVGNLGHVDLYIPDCAMLLRCDLKSTDRGQRYYVKIPPLVVQLERRKSLRLVPTDEDPVTVSITKSVKKMGGGFQQFKKPCVDISIGGFSIYVSKLELKHFQIGDEISSGEIIFQTRKLLIAAQVCSIIEIAPDDFNKNPYKIWRVNFRFSSHNQLSMRQLEKYIFEKINQDLHVITKT